MHLCILTVLNALLGSCSSATVIVRVGGCFWLCNVVLVEWFLLLPFCVMVMGGMLYIWTYGLL